MRGLEGVDGRRRKGTLILQETEDAGYAKTYERDPLIASFYHNYRLFKQIKGHD